MIKDFIVVEDVFDNVDEILQMAYLQNYAPRETHYQNAKGRSNFQGIRSKHLADIGLNHELYHKVNKAIFDKIFQQAFPEEHVPVQFGYEYETSCYFHVLREQDQYNDNWLHKDNNCILAGVVYLNRNPQENTGTIVYKNGKEVIVPNEFNKLVLYSPTFLHSAQRGFGQTAQDGRLTLTFFINAFRFRLNAAFGESDSIPGSGA